MKLKKIRNALLVVLTLALVSATAVAITWAVVDHASNNTKSNTFTTPNLDLQIGEDKWDGRNYGDDTTAIPTTGEVDLPISNIDDFPAVSLGYNLAQKYNPDQVINKNPSLKNSSAKPTAAEYMSGITNNEWVGMKVDYRVKAFNSSTALLYTISGTGDAATASPIGASDLTLTDSTWYSFPSRSAFEAAIAQISDVTTVTDPYTNAKTFAAPPASNTGDNANKWVTNDTNGKKFYYTSIIGHVGNSDSIPSTTTDLFKYVHIKKDWTTASATLNGTPTTFYEIMTVNNTKYYSAGLPEFDIVLKGYAVQADKVAWHDGTSNKAVAALSALMDAN